MRVHWDKNQKFILCPSLTKHPYLVHNNKSEFPQNLTWSLTLRSGSIVRVHKAGKILAALSFKLKYSAEARKPITPAVRAGGNGSRKARKNAGIRTFCRV